ncbi:MAG: bifunctional oligoribonuclease/PAP phosphatase NrnA [Candidatus Neomarinimicrobiota bacterium]
MQKHDWRPIIRLINEHDRILLTSHVNPDGDGLGSTAALFHVLKKLGKNPVILNSDVLPYEYSLMNADGIFQKYDSAIHHEMIGRFDLVIVFDIETLERIGSMSGKLLSQNIPMICIDHHPGEHTHFTLKVVDEKAPSTASLVYELIQEMDSNLIDLSVAEALYTGLMTDTGSFCYQNTTADAFSMASDLVARGVIPGKIFSKVYENYSPGRMRLIGMLFQDIHYEFCGQLAWATVTKEQIGKAGALMEEIDGFPEAVRSIRGVEVSIVFLETAQNRIRVSLRSKGKFVINGVAFKFSGGGHALAAGATIEMSLQEAVPTVLMELRKLFSKTNEVEGAQN